MIKIIIIYLLIGMVFLGFKLICAYMTARVINNKDKTKLNHHLDKIEQEYGYPREAIMEVLKDHFNVIEKYTILYSIESILTWPRFAVGYFFTWFSRIK